ncbi:hypothetical protein F4860DRAFT_520433 [Xylaria cubensis]|nr:hypothetical protein F4860DRAFT_520433 [Xylaria cubensis]
MTLRKALTQGKPSFSPTNSKNTKWPALETNNLVSWDAFNIQNLNASYGHILDSPIPEGELDVPNPNSVLSSVQRHSRVLNIDALLRDRLIGGVPDGQAPQSFELLQRDQLKPDQIKYTALAKHVQGGRNTRCTAKQLLVLEDN